MAGLRLTRLQWHGLLAVVKYPGAIARSNVTLTDVSEPTLYWQTADRLVHFGLVETTGTDRHGRPLLSVTDAGREEAAR